MGRGTGEATLTPPCSTTQKSSYGASAVKLPSPQGVSPSCRPHHRVEGNRFCTGTPVVEAPRCPTMPVTTAPKKHVEFVWLCRNATWPAAINTAPSSWAAVLDKRKCQISRTHQRPRFFFPKKGDRAINRGPLVCSGVAGRSAW